MKKITRMMLPLVAAFALLVVIILPKSASAADGLKTIVDLKILGEIDVLDTVKVGGNCDKIYAEVKKLVKLDDKLSDVDLKLKYTVLFNANGDAAKGKAVGEGELAISETQDVYTLTFDPDANPQGPAGEYAFKVYLQADKIISKPIILKVKVNGECQDNDGGKDDDGKDNDSDDNGKENDGANGGNDNGQGNGENGNGGKLPKTASPYANNLLISAILVVAGVMAFGLQRKFN